MITLFTVNREQIVVEDKPFAKGGEGAVYKIVKPLMLKNFCVKLYHANNQNQEKKKKIDFMVANQPKQEKESKFLLCWPLETVQNGNGLFVGYVMPLAPDGSIQLYQLCTKKINNNLPTIWKDKFSRQDISGIKNRLKLSVNLAIAINTLHITGKYVLVDLKPQNILVTSDARLSIIDLDSIQIGNKNSVSFHAKVSTPEYTPKEGNKLNPSSSYIPDSWDHFSLAIIIYELLLGIHPYAATPKGQYANASTIDDKIRKNLFVHGSKKNYLSVIPDIHNSFLKLPQSLREMFLLAFEMGNDMPTERPSASTWGETIYKELHVNNSSNLGNFQPSSPSTNPSKLGSKPPTSTRPLDSSPAVLVSINTQTSIPSNSKAYDWWKWTSIVLVGIFLIAFVFSLNKVTIKKEIYKLTDTTNNKVEEGTTYTESVENGIVSDSVSTLNEQLTDSSYSPQNYSNLLSNDPSNATFLNQRGDNYYNTGEFEKALNDYMQAYNIENDNPTYSSNVGFACASLNQHVNAVNWFSKALSLKQDAGWLYMRAVSNIEIGENQDAIKDLNIAIDLVPKKFGMYYYYRGIAKLKSGDKNEACFDWYIASEIGDKDAEGYINKYCH